MNFAISISKTGYDLDYNLWMYRGLHHRGVGVKDPLWLHDDLGTMAEYMEFYLAFTQFSAKCDVVKLVCGIKYVTL